VRTIGVVTVGRSDAGIYRPVLRAIQRSAELDLTLIVAGMHLAPEFGETWRELEAAGFAVDERIECTMASDSAEGTAKSIGLGVIAFGQLFGRSRPDILMLLGDRFEMLAAAAAALPFAMPIAHLHGGETSQGALDEAVRHSITKMSHLHFVATPLYRDRVVQLGEEPWRVTVSGAPSLDNLRELDLCTRDRLEAIVGLPLNRPTLLATFHPVTLEYGNARAQCAEFLAALEDLGLQVVLTYPNADAEGRLIIRAIEAFAARHAWATAIANLGVDAYFGLLRHAAAVVGNSSSGIIEAASFGVPVVNVGHRQRGRLRAPNVIDVDCERTAIREAVREALAPAFRRRLAGLVNPYGDGRAAARIVEVLTRTPLDQRLIMKRFHDLPASHGAALPEPA